MSKPQPTRKPALSVTLPDDVRAALDRLAAEGSRPEKKVFAGDIVREAIHDYLIARGITLDISVDRGGYRGSKNDETPSE